MGPRPARKGRGLDWGEKRQQTEIALSTTSDNHDPLSPSREPYRYGPRATEPRPLNRPETSD